MTLEDKIQKIWETSEVDYQWDQWEDWSEQYAVEDYKRDMDSWLKKDQRKVSNTLTLCEEMIRSFLGEGLTSNNEYLRKYTQLLSAESREDIITKEICND